MRPFFSSTLLCSNVGPELKKFDQQQIKLMDSPIKERVTAAVSLKNKFAAFCSDDEDAAAIATPSEVINKTVQVKKVEKPSAKKVPEKTTTATSSGNKKLSKPEKSEAVTAATDNKKEGTTATTRGRGRGNGREGTTRDNRRSDGATPGARRDGTTRDENRRNNDGRRDENRRNNDGRRDDNRREGKTEDERKNDVNRRRRPPQHQANENVPLGEGGEENVNVDRRPSRGDRGGRRPYRGGSRGGGRTDRTGLHDAPKKDGHGKGNWGTEEDELKGETEPTGETSVEKSAQGDTADKNDSGVEMEKEEEKPIGMTLHEWKEKNKVIEPETFNVRMPNADKKLNLAPLKKTEDENKENDEFVIMRREPREKHVDISVNFAATDNASSSGGNRGNRDGFRGRKRGDDRGTRGGNRNVQNRGSDKHQFNLVNDQFPALGGH